jgi:SOS-response transcriptional repressor LexA
MSHLDGLTARQVEIFEFIRASVESNGYPPSMREIGRAFDIRSPNGVMCHLHALEKKGKIVRRSRSARGITVIDEPLPDVDIEFDRLTERVLQLEHEKAELLERLHEYQSKASESMGAGAAVNEKDASQGSAGAV